VKLRVVSAPGPVSYPLIVSQRVELIFGKEGTNADAVADSLVSLVRRGLRAHYGALKGLLNVYPDLLSPIAVWRRGSAADFLVRGAVKLRGYKDFQITYYEEMWEAESLMNGGKVRAIVASSAVVGGRKLEGYIEEAGVEVPSSCGLHIINRNAEEELVSAYSEGLDRIKQDPEGSAELVVESLPFPRPKGFVLGVFRSSELFVRELGDYSDFEALIKGLE
jgi:ABC-type amino acid transport substrate-binding protein